MKKVLSLSVFMLLLLQGLALAYTATLDVGGTFSHDIYSIVDNTTYKTEGGGSIETSYLNGVQLPYLYCVDLFNTVYVPRTYYNTEVNTIGEIHGAPLKNADQVAWLLTTYGKGGQTYEAVALQAAIWHVVAEGVGRTYALDTSHYGVNSDVSKLYNQMLANLGSEPDKIANFLWISPGQAGDDTIYQGLVSAVPIPAAVWLLGTGIAGLVVIRRKIAR